MDDQNDSTNDQCPDCGNGLTNVTPSRYVLSWRIWHQQMILTVAQRVRKMTAAGWAVPISFMNASKFHKCGSGWQNGAVLMIFVPCSSNGRTDMTPAIVQKVLRQARRREGEGWKPRIERSVLSQLLSTRPILIDQERVYLHPEKAQLKQTFS